MYDVDAVRAAEERYKKAFREFADNPVYNNGSGMTSQYTAEYLDAFDALQTVRRGES